MNSTGVRLVDVLGALSFASDLAFGLEFEDGIRSCYIAARLAQELGADPSTRLSTYYASLLKDAGCTCWTSELAEFWGCDEITARRDLLVFGNMRSAAFRMRWMGKNVGNGLSLPARLGRMADVALNSDEFVREGFRSSCEVSSRIAERMGMPSAVQEALLHIFEQWDGRGFPGGLPGERIPLISRIILAGFMLGPVHRASGRAAASKVAREGRGTIFDPRVADAFSRLASSDAFWSELEDPDLWARLRAMEPGAQAELSEHELDIVAEAFADYIDLKANHLAAHSRRVASLAAAVAIQIGWTPEMTRQVRLGGLLHDLGLVTVPSFTLLKPESELSVAERECVRLHPYQGGRILASLPGFEPVVEIVRAHHERYDGSGSPLGLRANQIPPGAQVVAVADRYDDLTHDVPGRHSRGRAAALELLRREVGSGFAPDVVAGLERALDGLPAPANQVSLPGELTEREAEVLRLASRGLNRRDIGDRLGISEHTVRHHLSHIYDKIGVTTRVGATLWALGHDLFP